MIRKKLNKGLSSKLLAAIAVGGSIMSSGCIVYLDPWHGPLNGPSGIYIYPYPSPYRYRGRNGVYYYRHRHPNGYYYWSTSPRPRHKYKKYKKQ